MESSDGRDVQAMRGSRRATSCARTGAALLLAALLGFAQADAAVPDPATGAPLAVPFGVRVFVVNLFGLEAQPWIDALQPHRDIAVPGLSVAYPQVHCTPDAVCQMTTDMGHANAAASMMAVIYSGLFDLRQTYFVIAGIAGIDPERGTIGSAAWARFVVDSGIAHEVDARELPPGWNDGYFGVMTDSPDQLPKFEYHTEVFRLDEALLRKALELSSQAQLTDSPAVKAYRAHYPAPPANQLPAVIQCDTLTADTWWFGAKLGEHARRWTRLLTGGKGVYYTSQEEDNAVLAALTRGAASGLVDMRRVAVLRSGSDFDRPYPGQSALQSLQAQKALKGAIRISTDNLVLAGMPLVADISHHWESWRNGLPAMSSP
jgi:purine nucleoside permease